MLDVQRLKDTMKARHMTQQALADASGLHKMRISQYCHGKSEPRPAALKRLAEALDVPTEYLTGELEMEADNGADGVTDAIPNVLNARQAADALGMNGQALRVGLQKGVFRFGYAIKGKGKGYGYYIWTVPFMRETGVTREKILAAL